jgi:hypothetical protein
VIVYLVEPTDVVKGILWDLPIEDRSERDHVPRSTVQSRAPLLRGYWLDQDLMAVTGIGSPAVLKKLQAADAIRASYIGLPEGGRQRAWAARSVFRSYLAAQLSKHGRMSLVAAGHLIGAIRPNFIDAELHIDIFLGELQDRIERTWARRGLLDALPTVLGSITAAIPPVALFIEDWSVGYWSTPENARRAVLRVRRIDGSHPDISNIAKDSISRAAVSVLSIDIQAITRDFFGDLVLSGRK